MSFAEFYSNKQNQLLHFDLRGFVPTNLEAQQEERVKNDACAKAITAQLQHTKAQKNVPSTLWTPMQGLGDGLIALISSGATADQLNELLTNAVSQIEKQPAA
jgi:maltose-binding protein MalE